MITLASILIVFFWIIVILALGYWFYDYGKTTGFKNLKHDKKHGKVVL